MGWLAYNLAVTDVFFIEISENTPAWALATLIDFKGSVFFIGNDSADPILTKFLQMRNARRMFATPLEAVVVANADHN